MFKVIKIICIVQSIFGLNVVKSKKTGWTSQKTTSLKRKKENLFKKSECLKCTSDRLHNDDMWVTPSDITVFEHSASWSPIKTV